MGWRREIRGVRKEGEGRRKGRRKTTWGRDVLGVGI